jgi:hypothetical protein
MKVVLIKRECAYLESALVLTHVRGKVAAKEIA